LPRDNNGETGRIDEGGVVIDVDDVHARGGAATQM
jgi:hypothetical protein